MSHNLKKVVRMDCAQKALERFYYKYGKLVARKPLLFLIIPLMITIPCCLGLLKFHVISDTEYLYTPINGLAKTERSIMNETFGENDTDRYIPNRSLTGDGLLQVLLKSKTDGENIYDIDVIKEILKIDQEIRSLSVADTVSLDNMVYEDVCSKWNSTCISNPVLTILNSSSQLTPLSYPIHNGIFLGNSIADVETYENGTVKQFQVLLLSYFVKAVDSYDKARGNQWLKAVKDHLLNMDPNNRLQLSLTTSLSLAEVLQENILSMSTYVMASYVALMLFCVLSCLMLDCVLSKPWVALAGEVSAGMAIVTTVGLFLAMDVPFTDSTSVMILLVISIGIDDMFVMLSCWRQTSDLLTTEERMGQTMKIAAISITVTTLTDTIAFAVGTLVPFRASVLLCGYTVVAILFCYVYSVTFLAACMVYSGRREERNIHSLTCCTKATPRNKAGNRSTLFKLCCTGGRDKDPAVPTIGQNLEQSKHPFVTVFFHNIYSPMIMKTPVKIIIGLLYIIYLGFAIWGCTFVSQGFKVSDAVSASSYVGLFYKNLYKYFSPNFGPQIMVSFTETLNYSDAPVRHQIYETICQFENSEYFESDPGMMECWFLAFEDYLANINQTVSGMEQFITILTTQFLKQDQYSYFEADIKLNDFNTAITSSRFLIQASAVETSTAKRDLMLEARKLADSSPYNMTVFHPQFILFDTYTVIISSTLQTLALALASVFLVSVILLPSLLTVVLVVLSLLSILLGVFGYMSLWGITLSANSLIYLSMTVGFSVDFTAHICYHFATSKLKGSEEKTREALVYLGHPILQSGVTTVLGVAPFASVDTTVFVSLFKIVFLAIILGLFHGLVILPVVLSLIGNNLKPTCCKQLKKKGISSSPPDHNDRNADINDGNVRMRTVKEGWM